MAEPMQIVWMDLEMTGLVPEKDRILEIATLITDGELNIIAEGPERVIHQDDSVLRGMDSWNKKHHGESGLIEKVQKSLFSEAQVYAETLAFLKQHCPSRAVPLAGNSIHQDRAFLRLYMPDIESFLHYRMIDVSTIKELCKRWYPRVYEKKAKKKNSHRALDDIIETIEELKFYRDQIFCRASV